MRHLFPNLFTLPGLTLGPDMCEFPAPFFTKEKQCKSEPNSFMGLSERERGKIQAMNAFRLGVIDWGVRGYYGYEQTHPTFPDLEDDIREVEK